MGDGKTEAGLAYKSSRYKKYKIITEQGQLNEKPLRYKNRVPQAIKSFGIKAVSV